MIGWRFLFLFVAILLPFQGLKAASISVFFSPNGGAMEAVVRELGAAKETVTIQAYGFSSAPIAKAILAAKQRGVAVRAILDKSNETAKYSSAKFLANAGIPVWIDYLPHIAHSKVMVIDSKTIITGSFNFTKSAESSNVENLLVIHRRPTLAKQYNENFEKRLALSRAYQP